jgi:replication factor A1
MIFTIHSLRDGARGVTIRVRILVKYQPRVVKIKDNTEHRVVDIEVGDRTGRILLSLWDDMIDKVNEDDVVDIKNGYVTTFKGELRLNIGRLGHLSLIEDPKFPNTNELITKRWQKYRST